MIAIIDYEMGNLRSVQKGFEKVGHEAAITNDPAVLQAAEKIVLPGVGAFEDAIHELKRRDLVGPIHDVIDAETSHPEPFRSVVWRDRLYATQFHPEKSQADGLRILKNFAERG